MEGHKLEDTKQSSQNSSTSNLDNAVASVPGSEDKERLAAKVDAPPDVLVLCDSNDDNVQYQGEVYLMIRVLKKRLKFIA